MPLRLRTATLALALVVATACKGADGAAGPQGPQGPVGPQGPQGESGNGARIVFSGIVDANGEAARQLPPEAGSTASLPVLSCYLSDDGQTWLTVAVDTNSGTACAIGAAGNGLAAVMIGAPPGWRYQFVVVY